jgi:hypothetical protein
MHYASRCNRGVVHLLRTPLARDTFGAVLYRTGGNYLLNPATPSERRHLQLVSNNAVRGASVIASRSYILLFHKDFFARRADGSALRGQ